MSEILQLEIETENLTYHQHQPHLLLEQPVLVWGPSLDNCMVCPQAVGACPLIPLNGLSSFSWVAGVLDPSLTGLRQVTTGSGNDAVRM